MHWLRTAILLPGLLALTPVVEAQEPDGRAGETRSGPSRAQADAFIEDLDRALASRDSAAYMAHFDQTKLVLFFKPLEHRIKSLLQPEVKVKTEVHAYFTRGSVGIALLETVFQLPRKKVAVLTYTAFEMNGGKAVGRFSIETGRAALRGVGRRPSFRCNACNYKVEADNSWLIIPRIAGRGKCMEGVWLVSLRGDLFIETSVFIGQTQVPASLALSRCLKAAGGIGMRDDKAEPIAPPSTWCPSCFKGCPLPPDVTCARLTTSCSMGYRAEMSLVSIGRLRYMAVVRGKAATLDAQRRRIDKVIDSFRVIDPSLSAQQTVATAIKAHTGHGTFCPAGVQYTNRTHHFKIAGPWGWKGDVRTGDCLFILTYRPPGRSKLAAKDRCQLTMKAFADDSGDWTRARAERQVKKLVREAKGHTTTVDDWVADHQGFAVRQVRIDKNIVVRFLMRPKTLVIMHATSRDPQILRTLVKAMDTADGR